MSTHLITVSNASLTTSDEAIAMATMYTANHLNIKAIVALTESGTTPLWMSRIRSSIPIYGMSRFDTTRRIMTLYRSVLPIEFDATKIDRKALNQEAIATLQRLDYIKEGDLVIITKGDMIGIHGNTNSMKIYQVGPLDK